MTPQDFGLLLLGITNVFVGFLFLFFARRVGETIRKEKQRKGYLPLDTLTLFVFLVGCAGMTGIFSFLFVGVTNVLIPSTLLCLFLAIACLLGIVLSWYRAQKVTVTYAIDRFDNYISVVLCTFGFIFFFWLSYVFWHEWQDPDRCSYQENPFGTCVEE